MWTRFLHEALGVALITALTLAVFAIGELLRRREILSPEQSRKLLHVGGCCSALLFPVVFTTHWSVLAVCGGFTALILWLGHKGSLHAVDDVSRKTYGGALHPVALYLCYLLAIWRGNFTFFEISVLVLALSDTAAALVGERYGRLRYRVGGDDYRSLEGSAFFFLVTYAIVHHILLLGLDMDRWGATLLSLLIAVLVTLFEAVSLGGADNLVIPIGVMIILIKNAHPDVAAITRQIICLTISFALVCLPMRLFGLMAGSGRVVMSLLVYLASGLVSPFWGLATLLWAYLLNLSRALRMKEIKTVFALAALPFLVIMSYNIAVKVFNWRPFAVATPVFLASLFLSYLIVRSYERKH